MHSWRLTFPMTLNMDTRSRRSAALVLTGRPRARRSAQLDTLFGGPDAERPLVAVTSEDSAEAFVSDWQDALVGWPTLSMLVIVGDQTRSAVDPSRADLTTLPSGVPTVHGIEQPSDLSGLYDVITGTLDEFAGTGGAPLLYFEALDDVLAAATLEMVTLLVSDIRTQLLVAGADGYFVAEDSTDPATVATLATAIDDVIRLDGDGASTADAPVEREWSTPWSSRRDASGRPLDAVFDALGVSRRRLVLYALYRRRTPMETAELSRRIAVHEADGGEPSRRAVSRVHVSLKHVHLPKLVDLGVVNVDGETVSLADSAAEFVPFVTMSARAEGDR